MKQLSVIEAHGILLLRADKGMYVLFILCVRAKTFWLCNSVDTEYGSYFGL